MNIPPASKTSASTCRASACCGKRSCTTTRTSAASGCGCRMTGNASRSDLDCGGYAAAFLHLENIVILRRGDARRISKCETFAYLEILRCLTQLRMTMLRVVRCGKADRKSTRLNSSHTVISYAVFCLKKKKKKKTK